ncbi:oxidoreductase [Actinomadura sp. 9N407]|uniref:oxidoreductase n=1 Tax=Actinomadura sp. 9N407 TaxID=3375154 RepID=UPI0037A80F99
MAKWTVADVPDQTGTIAVVTGSNGGLGFVQARELARAGARTVLACRDDRRGERAADRIRAAVPAAEVDVLRLDLADLASVRAFAEEFGERHDGLDLLVNNAGVAVLPHRETADGFEMQFGTNHLGHFALTGLLLDRLLARPRPRVVTVSSGLHHRGRVDFDDLNAERGYDKWRAYHQSKLANLLFAYELRRRVPALRSVAAHPGFAATDLQLAGPRMSGNPLMTLVRKVTITLFAQSGEKGALPPLYAATVPDLPGGSFVGPDGRSEARGHPTLVRSSPASKDEETARRLWDVSEKLTGVHYPL